MNIGQRWHRLNDGFFNDVKFCKKVAGFIVVNVKGIYPYVNIKRFCLLTTNLMIDWSKYVPTAIADSAMKKAAAARPSFFAKFCTSLFGLSSDNLAIITSNEALEVIVMLSTTLKLEKRNEIGGSRPERLRKKGVIPAVVYGSGMNSSPAQVSAADLRQFLKTNVKNTIFNTEFAEEHDLSLLIKDIQYDPVNKEIIHVDLQKINPEEKVQVEVPVRITGGNILSKAGNVVVHQKDFITVECLPRDIPKHADADISDLKAGQSFTAGDLKFPAGISLISKPAEIILTVNGLGKEAEPEA